MVTSATLFALIGTLLFKFVIPAAIDYEPIKITVNENFNALPGQVSQGLESLEPGVVHQGTNFYFKPQLTLSQGYIPSHIEALISLLQQHHNSCTKDTSQLVIEKDKLIEILKPLSYLSSDFTKLPPPSSPLPVPIIITDELKPVTEELLVIPEAPVLSQLTLNDIPSVIEEVKNEESIILEESTKVFPPIPEISVTSIPEPIIINANPVTSEFVVISEAPILPPLSLNDDIPSIVEEEVKKEQSVILEELTGVFPPVPETSVGPIQKPFIPEAPILPPLSFNGIPSVIGEEVKKEDSIILDESTGVFLPIPEISFGPIREPIIFNTEPKPVTSEFVVIPEAPTLPPLSFNSIPPIIEEQVKKEESVILEESTGVFPPIPEISIGPIQKPIIPEAPTLPPLSFNDISPVIGEEVKKEDSIILEESTGVFLPIPEISFGPIREPIIFNTEPKPVTSEFVVIPEAPTLPPLSFNSIPPIIEEEVKKEESVTLEESTGVFPPIPEISVGLIQKPIIPEAPTLPPLSFNGIPTVIEEEVKKEESVILEESTGVFPPIPEISVGPTPEAIKINVEPKPTTTELLVIPDAPQLPSLSFNDVPLVFGEEVKLEGSIKLGDSMDVFLPIPEISTRPIPGPTVLSQTAESFALENNIFPVVAEEVKVEVPIVLEESIEVFPPISEISPGPTLKPIEEREITDSFVLEEISQPNPCTDCVRKVKETLPPAIIQKPAFNRLGAFSYVPSVSHFSSRVPTIKTKNLMVPKSASLKHLLFKNHPFRLPITPFPKLSRNMIKTLKSGNKNQFLPTFYAHNVVEKRIAPNMVSKKNGPKLVKMYIRSNVPKGPS